eukprot:764940-Hanusia_phi.AAC.1
MSTGPSSWLTCPPATILLGSQNCTDRSCPPHVTPCALPSCPRSPLLPPPSLFLPLTLDPEISHDPFIANTTDSTKSLCPWNVCLHLDTAVLLPVADRSHSFTGPSLSAFSSLPSRCTHLQGLVQRPRRQVLHIRREGYRVHGVVVPVELVDQLARLDVPQPARPPSLFPPTPPCPPPPTSRAGPGIRPRCTGSPG